MLTLQQMLEAAKTLSPEEREELCVALTGMQDDGAPPITEEAFAAGMESLGFLQRPRVPPQRAPFQPAATEGKPASEIIIEERR